MSYFPGTKLTRTVDRFDDDSEKAIYNEVEVIGQSQVQDLRKTSEWEGEAGTAISIRPQDFGPVIDLPQGQLEKEYEVTFAPVPPTLSVPLNARPIEVAPLLPTPEQALAAAAAEQQDAPQASEKE